MTGLWMRLQIRTIRNTIMPNMETKSKSGAAPVPEPPAAAPRGRVVESRDLLAGTSQLLIRHEGRLYRLQRTRSGKLILTA